MPDHGPSLFAGAPPNYVAHRPAYAAGLIDLLVERLGLDAGAIVLDLGCGPGTLTVPLAARCGRVFAVDPGPDMLDAARHAVQDAGCENVELVAALGEQLPEEITGLRAAVMGRSFHWMDKGAVLGELDRRIEPGGGVALVRTSGSGRPDWWELVAPITERYLGPRPAREATDHVPALLASPFSQIEQVMLGSVEHRWTPDSIVGYLHSISHSVPHRFGDRLAGYDAEVRAAVTEVLPHGGLVDRIPTEVIVGHRPGRR